MVQGGRIRRGCGRAMLHGGAEMQRRRLQRHAQLPLHIKQLIYKPSARLLQLVHDARVDRGAALAAAALTAAAAQQLDGHGGLAVPAAVWMEGGR